MADAWNSEDHGGRAGISGRRRPCKKGHLHAGRGSPADGRRRGGAMRGGNREGGSVWGRLSAIPAGGEADHGKTPQPLHRISSSSA